MPLLARLLVRLLVPSQGPPAGLVRHPLGLGDRGHASRADRVDRDAVLPQDRVQVRRERGRLTLSENSVQSGVLRQEGSPTLGRSSMTRAIAFSSESWERLMA